MNKTGVSPLDSLTVLKYICETLEQRKASSKLISKKMLSAAGQMGKYLPDHFFPDLYLEKSLLYEDVYSVFFLLDSFERNYINYKSQGTYFTNTGVPLLCLPEDYTLLAGLQIRGNSVLPFSAEDDLQSTEQLKNPDHIRKICADFGSDGEEPEKLKEFLNRLSEMPVRFRIRRTGDGCELLFITGIPNSRDRFVKKDYKENILEILRSGNCTEEALHALEKVSFNWGIPFYDSKNGYQEKVITVDPAFFTLIWKGGKISDCRTGIRIMDKNAYFYGTAQSVTVGFQWHITDECDQRCKHCYLFGEDARLKCVSTPWDQMIHTLDEMEKHGEEIGALVEMAVSGGDPILHPRFWDLAEEIHRRGIRWSILGNPFHLNEEVCRKLKEAGCEEYQLSLDGLEPFHDYLRKPGSFQATIGAIKLLNDAGIKPQLMATACRQNLDDIIECMDLAVKHDIYSFAFARYCATSPEKAKELYPTAQEYRRFLLKYYQKRKAFEEAGIKTKFVLKEHLFTLLRYELGEFEIPQYAVNHPDVVYDGCHLGIRPAILANGDMMACRRMESVVGNIKTMSISEACDCEAMKSYNEVKNIKKCKDCELLNWCRGCRAVGFNATGDLQAQDPCCWKMDD